MRVKRRARRRARRLFLACCQGERLDAGRARRAAVLLGRSGRRGRLAVLSHFHRLARLEAERHRALVESAHALPSELRVRLERGLERRYGPGLQASFVEDPALIGGVRVTVASDVYDGSLRGALLALERRF
jgi:F-type H+-transporting ATPase subunit delta